MKELTALDIYYLIKELQILKDSKVDQIYQPENEVLIRFHSSNLGKRILRISKNFVFITDFKEEQEMNPKQFCMSLRKNIKNFRIRNIEQISFERVIKVSMNNRDTELFLFIELFSKGNVILTNKELKIINSLHKDKLKNIIPGQIYNIPEKEFNILDLKENEFKKIIQNSKISLVKTLAIDLGLGGIYSEFLLKDFDKDVIASDVNTKDISKLFKSIKDLLNKEIKPSLLNERIVPFETEKNLDCKTFNDALSQLLVKEIKDKEEKKSLTPFLKKKIKIEKIIETQTEAIKKLEKQIKENSEKGELIYNNYQTVNKILEQLKIARKEMSWKDIKSKLKNHKVIKNIDEKNSSIELDL